MTPANPAAAATSAAPAAAAAGRGGTRWYEFLLAAVLAALLAAAIVAAAWWSRGAGDWRGEAPSSVFLAAMLAVAAGAAIAFLVYLIVRASRRAGPRPRRQQDSDAHESPAGMRLLGLALLALLFLILAWVHAPPPFAHALAANLLYPAAFALALVLLFDKASRAWAVKRGGVSFREWLHCDAFTILLVLGYLNLVSNADPAAYSSLFWDALHVGLFVFAFWLVDRKFTRLRWLAGLAYLTLLPILLWIWRLSEGAATAGATAAAAAQDPSWWSSPWPFIVLGLVACAVEIIALAATGRGEDDRDDGAAGHIVKDALFFAVYGGLLIAAAQ